MRSPRDLPLPETDLFREADANLLDLVDNLLARGVVISGDLVLGLAGVDLIYLKLSVLLCAAERVLSAADPVPSPLVPPGGTVAPSGKRGEAANSP